ncbi:MAG: hypothetical protein GX432_11420 [Candidatus Atribacteria bacterium]|nr:hypothetical protein [Candidatus Atribacteria bacterium]
MQKSAYQHGRNDFDSSDFLVSLILNLFIGLLKVPTLHFELNKEKSMVE